MLSIPVSQTEPKLEQNERDQMDEFKPARTDKFRLAGNNSDLAPLPSLPSNFRFAFSIRWLPIRDQKHGRISIEAEACSAEIPSSISSSVCRIKAKQTWILFYCRHDFSLCFFLSRFLFR